MGSSPIFTEVIDVELNSGPLEESLTNLISMYKSKLEELSGSGLDAGTIGGLNVSAINADLGSVRTELKSLTDAFMEAFGQIAATSTTTGATVKETVTAALSETDAAAKKSTLSQLENLSLIANGSEEAWATFASAAQKALTDGFDPRVRMTEDLTNNLFSLIKTGGKEAFDALNAQQLDWALKAKQTYAEVEAAQSMSGSGSTAGNAKDALNEQIALGNDIIAVTRRQRTEQEALGTEMLASINRQRSEQMALGNDTLALISRERSEQMALGNDIVASINRQRAEQMALGNDTLAIIARERAAQEALGDAIVAITRRTAAEQEAASKSSSGSSASSGIFGNLAGQIATLAEIQIEWDLIQGTIDLAKNSVEAFFGFFKNGLTYLEDIETRSAALQGVLAANVTFSQDQATNFQLAGVAAGQLNKEIQDSAIKYGVSVDILTRSFKSFVDTGGVSLTHSVDDALQASTLLSVAIKASGKDTETTRSALSEIPKLLDGTITSTSKILETLGISTTEWKAMNAEARSQQDLTDQLRVRLQSYLQVAEDSADRFGAVKQTLELIYDRTTALAAQEFWPVLKEDLQQIRQFLIDNKTQIDACAVAMGDFAKSFLEIADAKTVMGALLTIFQAFAISLIYTKNAAQGVVDGLKEIYYGIKLLSDSKLTNLSKGLDEYTTTIKEDLASIQAIYEDGANIGSRQIAEIDAVENPASPTAADPLGGTGKKPPPDNTKDKTAAITALMKSYTEAQAILKTFYENEQQQIALSVAQRKTAVEEGTQQTQDSVNEEYAAQLNLIEIYKQKAEVIKAPAASKTNFDTTLDTRAAEMEAANQKAVTAAQIQAAADKLRIEDQGYAQSLAAAKKNAADEIAVIEAKIKAGTISASQGYSQELTIATVAHNAEDAILKQEVVAAGANADLKQAALAKLKASDDAYTAFVKANAEQRTAAGLKELVAADTVENNSSKTAYETLVNQTEANKQFIETNLQAAQSALMLANANLQVTQTAATNAANELAYAKSIGIAGVALDAYIKKLDTANAAKQKAQTGVATASKAVVDTDPIVPALQQSLSDWKTLFSDFSLDNQSFAKDLTTFGENLANTMTTSASAISEASKIATGLMKAIEEGGAQGAAYGLGATGGALSSVSSEVANATKSGGSLISSLSTGMKSLFANAGVVGSLMSAAAGLISVITSLFTAAAQRIADNIKKAFDTTMQAYQNGDATLQATLQQVQAERTDAITSLSGEKGGQGQLDKLLPQLDAEIAQLQQQQKQIIDNFDLALQKLQMNSDVLGQTLDTWTQINASIQEYIAAGGDAATAAAYMSASLEKMRSDAATALAQGDQDAIAAALSYNALLVQRQALTDAYNKSKFDTMNVDALERRASNGVDVGLTQTAADTAYETQLSDLNTQINQAAIEVSMYKQIYDIASDTATLQAEQSALQIQALATQLQTLKDQATVYNSIYENQDGTFGTNNAAGTAGATNTTVIQQLQVNLVDDGTIDGEAIANSIQSELERSGRYGTGSTFSTN